MISSLLTTSRTTRVSLAFDPSVGLEWVTNFPSVHLTTAFQKEM